MNLLHERYAAKYEPFDDNNRLSSWGALTAIVEVETIQRRCFIVSLSPSLPLVLSLSIYRIVNWNSIRGTAEEYDG